MHHVSVSLKLDKSFLLKWFGNASLSSIYSPTQLKACCPKTNLPRQVNITSTVHDYAGWLKGCTHCLSLNQGRVIHADIVNDGFESHPIIGSALINMYSKCGSLEDAGKVFDMVLVRDVVLWSAIIVACANHRNAEKGLHLFEQMQLEGGLTLDKQLLMYVLKACAGTRALKEGRATHIIITKQGLEADEFVGNSLVDMYCKCGSLKDAHGVFDNVVIHDVVFWTALICGYVGSSLNNEALQLFWKMHEKGIMPNSITYECIIRACSTLGAMHEGKRIFADIVKLGYVDSHVGVGLIHMFCNFGSLHDAHKVFRTLNSQDIVSWTVLITGYAEQGHGEVALRLYESMRKGDTKPDEAIFVCVLKICSELGAFQEGQMIYVDIILEGLESALCLKQSLMDMYIKCASLEDAYTLFEGLLIRDVVSCSTIIAGYVLHGYDTKALKLFEDMQMDGIQPNESTYSSILKTCASLKKLKCGKLIHNKLVILGFESDVFIRSTLIDMYGSCRRVEEACNVFNNLPHDGDVVLCNTMIGVYVEHDWNQQALQLYEQLCLLGLVSNYVTLLWFIRACPDIEQGRLIHALVVKQGCDKHTEVQNTVIGMYTKMGTLDDAHIVFKSLTRRTLGSYNALLAGFSCYGHVEKALQFYHQMIEEGIQQDQSTFLSMLKICATLTNLYIGRLLFTTVVHNALDCEPFLLSAVMDLFAKSGSLRDAVNVFNRLCLRDADSWNALVAAYADNGFVQDAQKSFMSMQVEGVNPDSRTFLCLLNVCSHGGISELSYQYFQAINIYGIVPNAQHFACLIDTLGRTGQLSEAKMLALIMPMDPSVVAWTTLLESSLKHGLLDRKLNWPNQRLHGAKLSNMIMCD